MERFKRQTVVESASFEAGTKVFTEGIKSYEVSN